MIVSGLYVLLAALGLIAWLLPILGRALSRWQPSRIGDSPADGTLPLPRLSVIVPALNEEATIAPAMQSLLAVDYPDVEIIAVNDRSTDRTGQILDDLARNNARLRVVHVRNLPSGWLGKNHAIHAGSLHATGQYFLLTDADVEFERSVLRKAVRYALSRQLDHLVVFPEMIVQGFWETLMVWFFSVMFSFKFKPWKVPDPRSKAHIGVGAFNLVRAEPYRKLGGHSALRMDITEELKLGKCLKQAGGKAEVAYGRGAVRVRWVVGLAGIVNGLAKNAFAGHSFQPLQVFGSLFALLLVVIWPFIGLFGGPTVARVLCVGSLLTMLLSAYDARPKPGVSPLYPLAFPVAALILGYTIFRSMLLTYRQGGIVWRGTLYPLDELRRGVV